MSNKYIEVRSLLCLLILSALLFISLVASGCATSQRVNLEVLEASKAKTFKLGVVKAAGSLPSIPFAGSSHLSAKEKALARIPIEDICATLKEEYALQIDTNVDRTPKVVKERSGNGTAPPPTRAGFTINLQPTTENAYYGNIEYDNASTIWLMLGGNSKTKNDQDVPEIMNVSYGFEVAPFTFKAYFLYAITIKSSGKDVLSLTGIVETIPLPMKGLIIDEDGIWNEYVEYATRINNALKRDLLKTTKKS